jgi:uncharacterized membrane protein
MPSPVDNIVVEDKVKYLDLTHKLNDYNEIYNLNKHLLDTNNMEYDKLYNGSNQIKTKLMKSKQEYMLLDYSINEYKMYSNLLAFTIFIVCVLLFFVTKATKETQKQLIIILSVIAVIYLIIVIVILKTSGNRRNYAWTHWYWDPMVKK